MGGTKMTNSSDPMPKKAPAKKAPAKKAPAKKAPAALPAAATPKKPAKISFARPAIVAVAKAVAGKITAWSYSRWCDYQQCPLKAKLKHVDKLKEPGSPAMERGSAIHKLAEAYLRGLARVLAKELKGFGEFFKALKKLGPQVEQDWAFTVAWAPTGWFDANAWCRVKVDAASYAPKTRRLRVVDHKTGKINPDHLEQLSLYALAGFLMHPDAVACDTELWYLDHPVSTSGLGAVNPVRKEFLPSEVPALKKVWEGRVKPMLTDTRFAPRPNDRCRWCHFRASNGGPCKF